MAVEEVFHFTMEVIFPAVWGGRPRPPLLTLPLARQECTPPSTLPLAQGRECTPPLTLPLRKQYHALH